MVLSDCEDGENGENGDGAQGGAIEPRCQIFIPPPHLAAPESLLLYSPPPYCHRGPPPVPKNTPPRLFQRASRGGNSV